MNSEMIIAIITGVFGLATGIATTYLSKNKVNKDEEPQAMLKDHHFFNRIEILSDNVNRTFTLENKGKEVVFKDIISNQLILFKKNLEKIASDVDAGSIVDNTHLYNKNLQCFNEILNSLHTYYKYNNSYTLEEQAVLDIVMKKYENWHQSKIDFISENLMMACNSPFYNDVETRTAVILDLYLGVAIDTINYAEKTLNNINGDLKGLVFKGVTI